MAPLHGTQSEASRPSVAEIFAQSTAASIFGTHLGMSSIATTSLNSSLDIATTSLEATTLPENAYLTSDFWIGMHDWGGLPQMPLAMGVMDSDWRQATSLRAFMVIDDKGGEEHGFGLKL